MGYRPLGLCLGASRGSCGGATASPRGKLSTWMFILPEGEGRGLVGEKGHINLAPLFIDTASRGRSPFHLHDAPPCT